MWDDGEHENEAILIELSWKCVAATSIYLCCTQCFNLLINRIEKQQAILLSITVDPTVSFGQRQSMRLKCYSDFVVVVCSQFNVSAQVYYTNYDTHRKFLLAFFCSAMLCSSLWCHYRLTFTGKRANNKRKLSLLILVNVFLFLLRVFSTYFVWHFFSSSSEFTFSRWNISSIQ